MRTTEGDVRELIEGISLTLGIFLRDAAVRIADPFQTEEKAWTDGEMIIPVSAKTSGVVETEELFLIDSSLNRAYN